MYSLIFLYYISILQISSQSNLERVELFMGDTMVFVWKQSIYRMLLI